MSDPDPMMTPVFPEGTRIVYETEKHKQFKGAIRSATRITGTDFFKYTVDLFEEKQASSEWKVIPLIEDKSVSDYSLTKFEG